MANSFAVCKGRTYPGSAGQRLKSILDNLTHFHLLQKPARLNRFSENYQLGSYFGLSLSHMNYNITWFNWWQKPARLNRFSENYHPGSYFGLSPGHVNYLATVLLKYELGNKTSLSYLSGPQSKLSAPQCCGPPEELSPKVIVHQVR